MSVRASGLRGILGNNYAAGALTTVFGSRVESVKRSATKRVFLDPSASLHAVCWHGLAEWSMRTCISVPPVVNLLVRPLSLSLIKVCCLQTAIINMKLFRNKLTAGMPSFYRNPQVEHNLILVRMGYARQKDGLVLHSSFIIPFCCVR